MRSDDFNMVGRLDSFVANALDAAAMFDRDMRYLATSPRWLKDYCIEGPILGRSHYEVFPEIPDRWREIHNRALAGETLSEECEAFERAGGAVQWLRWQVGPWRLADGGVGGVVIFTHDVTEMKRPRPTWRSARRFCSILDTVPEAMIVIDERG